MTMRELRINLGLSQTELGDEVGCTATEIGLYENDRRAPHPRKRKKIADALGVLASDLWPVKPLTKEKTSC